MAKEYITSKCKGGPGFPHCTCCNPSVGFLGNGGKLKSHRIVRRKAKQELTKEMKEEE